MARDYTAPRIWMDLIQKHLKPGQAFTKTTLFTCAVEEKWESESFLRCHGPAVAIQRMLEEGLLRKIDGLYIYQPTPIVPREELSLEERVRALEATVSNILGKLATHA